MKIHQNHLGKFQSNVEANKIVCIANISEGHRNYFQNIMQ